MNKRKMDNAAEPSVNQDSSKRAKQFHFNESCPILKEITNSPRIEPHSIEEFEMPKLKREDEVRIPESDPVFVASGISSSVPNTPAKKSYTSNRRSGSLEPQDAKTFDDHQLIRQPSIEIIDEPKEINRIPGTLTDARNFLAHAKNINWMKPKNAFVELNGARLCGFFDNLKIDDELFITDRPEERSITYKFQDDLPEMTTCCRYREGRYAIWRDDPKQDEIYIVHVTNDEHFPSVQVIGDRMEHILYHLAKKDHVLLKQLLPKQYSFSKIQREMHAAVKQRSREKLGDVPTGVGIWVPLEENQAYFNIGHGAELKKIITQIGEDIKALRMSAENQLFEVYATIDLANEDGLFGMGLELGHWLWMANYRSLMDKAKEYLIAAYTYLGRDEYVNIVEERYSKKEEIWKKHDFKSLPRHLRYSISLNDCGPKYLTRGQLKKL